MINGLKFIYWLLVICWNGIWWCGCGFVMGMLSFGIMLNLLNNILIGLEWFVCVGLVKCWLCVLIILLILLFGLVWNYFWLVKVFCIMLMFLCRVEMLWLLYVCLVRFGWILGCLRMFRIRLLWFMGWFYSCCICCVLLIWFGRIILVMLNVWFCCCCRWM